MLSVSFNSTAFIVSGIVLLVWGAVLMAAAVTVCILFALFDGKTNDKKKKQNETTAAQTEVSSPV